MSKPVTFTTMTIRRETRNRLSKLQKLVEKNGNLVIETWDDLLNRLAELEEVKK